MVQRQRTILVNPHGGKPKRRGGSRGSGSSRKQTKARRKNPDLLTLGFLNPFQRSSATMARKKKASGGTKKHRKANPTFGRRPGAKRKKSSHRRRSNPSFGISSSKSILIMGFWALVGLVLARQVPQWLLKEKNNSWMGYLANLGTTLGLWVAGTKMLGAETGKALAIGGGLYTAQRVIGDNFSPVGKVLSLSGVGDAASLGDIQPGYFPLPVPTNGAGIPIIPNEIRPIMPPAAMAAASGMSGINSSTRFQSRF